MNRLSLTINSAIASLFLSLGAITPVEAVSANLGNVSLNGGQSSSSLQLIDTEGILTTLTASFNYVESGGDFSWASDLQIYLDDGIGHTVAVGGLESIFHPIDVNWNPSGDITDEPGFYTLIASADLTGFGLTSDGNDFWSITAINDWNGDTTTNSYNNLVLDLNVAAVPFDFSPSFGILAVGFMALVSSAYQKLRMQQLK